jgi:hypothetical protein
MRGYGVRAPPSRRTISRRGALRALLGLGALLLAACASDSPESRLRDYTARLARPLDLSISAGDTLSPAPPRWEALQIPIESGSLDGLDFLRLRGCALQHTVARRNSSLGRLAPPSQRLLLDLAFLREVQPCIDKLEADGRDALATQLRDSASLKKRQLPALVFNATLGNAEYRDFWRGATALGTYPEGTGSSVTAALRAVSADAGRWLAGDFRADERALELNLGTIARGDGGELIAALALQAAHLDAASAALEARAADRPLCAAGQQPRAATILRTVVRKYFLAGVQPWSAALEGRRHDLLPPLRHLEALLADTLPAPYVDWQRQRDAQLAAYRGAPRRHVRALQALLGACFEEFAPASATQHHDPAGNASLAS